MYACLDAKFSRDTAQSRSCREALLRTDDAFLVGHNAGASGDWVWSNNGKGGDGANWMGLQLMLIRDELQGAGLAWTRYIQGPCGVDITTGRLRRHVRFDAWQAAVCAATRALVEELGPPADRHANL